MLNVGGRRFMTTAATLLAVEGSFLWKLMSVQQAAGTPKPGAEFFIDRNGSVSAYTLKRCSAAARRTGLNNACCRGSSICEWV